jgi:hypothetical protein
MQSSLHHPSPSPKGFVYTLGDTADPKSCSTLGWRETPVPRRPAPWVRLTSCTLVLVARCTRYLPTGGFGTHRPQSIRGGVKIVLNNMSSGKPARSSAVSQMSRETTVPVPNMTYKVLLPVSATLSSLKSHLHYVASFGKCPLEWYCV